MSETFGVDKWIGINIDSHLDVRIAEQRNSGTPYRQLLEEGLILPKYFLRSVSRPICSLYTTRIYANSVHRISLELLRSRADADLELKEGIKQEFVRHSSSLNTFFGFDLDVVRSADAPGTSAPSL